MTRRYNGKTKTAENKGKGYPKETHGADTGREGKGGQPRSTGAREGAPGRAAKRRRGTKPRRQERGRDPHGARRGAQDAPKAPRRGAPRRTRAAPSHRNLPVWAGRRGGPAGLSDTQRAPSSARDLPQQHTPAVSIQAAPAANRLLACQGRRLPPPPQRAVPLDRAQGRVLFRGGAAGPWARAARASQDPKATAGMGPRRLPRAQARRMGRTPMKPARPPESCCGGTRAGATRARARPTHAKRQKAQRKDPPNGAHKCSVAPFLILIL